MTTQSHPPDPRSDASRHLLDVARIDGRYRVVIRGTRRLARNGNNHPVDGGGHPTRDQAYRQTRAITRANIQAHRIQPPCR
jgi:hypothetical protein